jgi:hypothetical protein
MPHIEDVLDAAEPTVQDRLIEELQRRIREMTHDDGTPMWETVVTGSVDAYSNITAPALGIDQGGEEVVQYLYPLIQKNMTVFLDFRFEKTEGIDPYKVYRYYLGRLQSAFFGDNERQTLGGRVNGISETGSNPQIEGDADSSPGGVLMLLVQYEHYQGDPTRARG